MRRFVIICLLALMVPATAQANRWPDAMVQEAIQTADNHWPSSPCYGRHDIRWMTGAELDAAFPDSVIAIARATMGEPCEVWIAWDRVDPSGVYRPGIFLCSVLEHEFGHNAGLGHSDDPHSIMHIDILYPATDCVVTFPQMKPRHHHRGWNFRRWALK